MVGTSPHVPIRSGVPGCAAVVCYAIEPKFKLVRPENSQAALLQSGPPECQKCWWGHNLSPRIVIRDYCTYQTKIGEDQSPHLYNFRRPCQQRKGKLYVAYIGCLYGRFMVQSWPGNAYLFPKKEKKKLGYALRVCVDQLLPAQ